MGVDRKRLVPIDKIEAEYKLDNKDICERFGGKWINGRCWFDAEGGNE